MDIVSGSPKGQKKTASPAQCRAARAMLHWTQTVLAERAGVARKTVADFEIGTRPLYRRTRRDIMATLEKAGIEFTWADDSSGVLLTKRGDEAREPPP